MIGYPDLSKDIKTHQMHNFTKKLLQRSIFRHLKDYVGWQVKLRQGKRASMPRMHAISINLDLTTACNYYCDHCIDLNMINSGNILKTENIKSLISNWVKEGLRSVIVIGGGEPVLHPDFEEIIAFLKSKKLQVGIATNGSRVTSISRVAFLLDKHDWVRISLDTAINKTFQKIHNPRINLSLKDILGEVKIMRSKFAQYQLGFSFLVLSRDLIANNKNLVDNISQISLAAKNAKESGFNYFSVKPFISPFPYRFTKIQKNSLERIRKQVSRAKRLEDETFKVVESLNMLALFNNFNEKLKKQTRVCHSQFFRWVVTPDGIFNCPTWRGFAKSYLLDTEHRYSKEYCKELRSKLRERIENFNAAKECSSVSCIYNNFNWFIEDLVRNPIKIKELSSIGDYGDYFF
ncbi:MAG: radical SAM protein [Candidatus Omnitrophota bacterium]|nr:radical SAM protein [Candidatus Omnitrophota bacterium]